MISVGYNSAIAIFALFDHIFVELGLSDRARKNNAISICLLQAQPDLMYVTRVNGENSRLNRPLPGFI